VQVLATADGMNWSATYTETGYGDLADAVLAVLPAPTNQAAACPECGDAGACNGGPCPLADRRARWEHAAWAAGRTVDRNALAAYMAVADTEQAELRAQLDATFLYRKNEELRAEVERLRTNRATVLREAEAMLRAQGKQLTGEYNDSDILHEEGAMATVAAWGRAADAVRRLADEAQQPETEAYPLAFPWATLMDTEDLAEFLAEVEHAIATPGATPAEALAAAEQACSTWRLIAEAQHGHNPAPGPAATEERREPHPTEADMAHALNLLNQQPAPAPTEEPTR
jgi:hypothetical protein